MADEELKRILLGNFIFKNNVKKFLDYLEKTFSISKCNVFIYDIDNNDNFFVTFKFTINPQNKVNFKKYFPTSIPIHKKGDAYYTINALNRLIEVNSEVDSGNIDHKSHEIDWSNYQNNIILLEDNELVFHHICRIF